jgi:adenosylcobinamide-GDP ribazoletransferase
MRDALGLLTTFGRRGGELRAPALRWFPVVGLALGALLGATWWSAARLWPATVAASIVVLADLACTGMLHVDGLADSADGLLPHASRERRLAIMRAPDVGAFGVATVTITLLLRVVALAAVTPSVLLLAGLWCTSRALVASAPAFVPYARAEGIASPLLAAAPVWPAIAILPAAAIAGLGSGAAGAVAVGAGAGAAMAVIGWAWRRIGGFTGDVLGAAIVVGETVGLVVAAARW